MQKIRESSCYLCESLLAQIALCLCSILNICDDINYASMIFQFLEGLEVVLLQMVFEYLKLIGFADFLLLVYSKHLQVRYTFR